MNKTSYPIDQDDGPPLPCILIPAYKPDQKLLDLIGALRQLCFTRIILVDDGSGDPYAGLFKQAGARGCVVLRHAVNLGKGRALKTGINEAMNRGLADRGIITADADGQHSPSDILKIAGQMEQTPEDLVLGIRHFTGPVPWSNRLGNAITRTVFSLIHGERVYDTQTGLRGLPTAELPLFLGLSGERYEYEMNMLLAARPNHIRIVDVPIETIYIEGNRSSHFRVLQDSVMIYALIFKYILSSILSFIVDYGLFIIMTISFPGQLLASVVVARSISSFFNFMLNRNLVFRQREAPAKAAAGYYLLVIAIMGANYGLIRLLTGPLNLDVYLAKVIADIILYYVGFRIQRDFIFRRHQPKAWSAR